MIYFLLESSRSNISEKYIKAPPTGHPKTNQNKKTKLTKSIRGKPHSKMNYSIVWVSRQFILGEMAPKKQ